MIAYAIAQRRKIESSHWPLTTIASQFRFWNSNWRSLWFAIIAKPSETISDSTVNTICGAGSAHNKAKYLIQLSMKSETLIWWDFHKSYTKTKYCYLECFEANGSNVVSIKVILAVTLCFRKNSDPPSVFIHKVNTL